MELRRRPARRHLRDGAAQGRQAAAAARERRGEAREGRRRRRRCREGRGEGQGREEEGQGRRQGYGEARHEAGRHRLRGARRPGRQDPGRGRQLRGAGGGRGPPAVRQRRAQLLRPAQRRHQPAADVLDREARGLRPRQVQARRVGGVRRRHEGAGAAGREVPAPRGQEGRRRGQDGGNRGPRDGPRPDRGVGGDLRRGLAPLPRLLLRPEHARLRLEGDRRPLPRAAARRRPPLRPQLRAHRDGGGAQLRPHLHLGRRLPDPGAGAGRAARGALRARPQGRALPDRLHLPRAQRGAALPLAADRGRRRRQGRRLRAGHRRRRARRQTTTRTGCSSTRPTR